MKKYMGNKSSISNIIYETVNSLDLPEETTIFDAFSGTTNVGKYFKKKGYTVLSNDINSVSRVLGRVYIETNSLPTFDNLLNGNYKFSQNILAQIKTLDFIAKKEELYTHNLNTCSDKYMKSIYNSNAYNLLTYLTYFSTHDDYSKQAMTYQLPTDNFIHSNYCFYGENSKYFNLVTQRSLNAQIRTLKKYATDNDELQAIINILYAIYEPPYLIENLPIAIEGLEKYINKMPDSPSSLSTSLSKLKSLNKRKNHIGRRMFFSETHGKRVDTILSTIIFWFKNNLINKSEYNYLLCALLEAVALFSNTSATYQAFYKTYQANTKQPFRLVIPEIIASDKTHNVFCEDTFDLIKNIQYSYDVLYLDPPYNWRLYDSNYHLLNLIADFEQIIDNYEEYEAGIIGASGENRSLDRDYTNYNRRETFEELLFELIKNADCRYVLISYSNSNSNHNKNSQSSLYKIKEFLSESNYFIPDSYQCIKIKSKNFESRKSKHKEKIKEFIFVAEKKHNRKG